MAAAILGAFCLALILCLVLKISVLYALCFGLIIFVLYGRKKGFSWRELAKTAFEGVWSVKDVIMIMFLIGILTAVWRAAGTISVIVCYASALIKPAVFLLMTFLLNCAVSVLTGTAFGTVATMGVICATMGSTMGINPALTGGAVLSGIFFGDRCSPVSTSALLVSTLTQTDMYANLRRLVKSALLPFIISCAVYTALGIRSGGAGEAPDLYALFGRVFELHPLALLPAAAIIVLAAFRVNVEITMIVSILVSVPLCIFLQKIPADELLRAIVTGFYPHDAEVAAMVGGGGIVSMLSTIGIVGLSSSYSGIFQKTGLLDGVRKAVSTCAEKTSPATATALTSIAAAAIACNQTLAILLTHQLCESDDVSGEEFAVTLEDTAVVIPPLVPWCIAGSVPLATVGAPTSAIFAACYLYLLPVWRIIATWKKEHKR